MNDLRLVNGNESKVGSSGKGVGHTTRANDLAVSVNQELCGIRSPGAGHVYVGSTGTVVEGKGKNR